MLKKRIIPIELLSKNRLVKTTQFELPRDVGDPIKSSQVYSDQDADELILLHIDRLSDSIEVLVSTVEKILKECFVPFTVGGGVRTLSDAERLFNAGADKIIINSSCYDKPSLISQIANVAGSQAVVIGIDVRKINGKFKLFSNNSKKEEEVELSEHIKKMISLGAGEVFIQSVDKDGSMNGYDLELIEIARKFCDVPLIIAGGAGNFNDLYEAFCRNVDAVACGSLFNFGDNNPLRAKAFLKNYNVPLKII
tara:strand:+ start:255 stop:1010 length:756 start_codon:yes stop_codon:yes gene_type:complete